MRLCVTGFARRAGLVVSSFKVKCMRSWRPFCCGFPGLIRSIAMPRRRHQTASLEKIEEGVGAGEGDVVGLDGSRQAALRKEALNLLARER